MMESTIYGTPDRGVSPRESRETTCQEDDKLSLGNNVALEVRIVDQKAVDQND